MVTLQISYVTTLSSVIVLTANRLMMNALVTVLYPLLIVAMNPSVLKVRVQHVQTRAESATAF